MHLFDLFLCVFKMSSQIACLRGGIFALVAFIWLVSTMCFQMSVQNACIRGYEVALDASFVRLFCNGCFQMCSQTVSPRGGIVTLVALVQFFSIICFQMCPQMACARGCNVTFAPVKLEMPTEEVHYLAMQSRAGDHWCQSRSSTLLDKRVEQKKVVWSAEITKYQIRNIIFLNFYMD